MVGIKNASSYIVSDHRVLGAPKVKAVAAYRTTRLNFPFLRLGHRREIRDYLVVYGTIGYGLLLNRDVRML